MQQLEKQTATPIDESTHKAIEDALEEARLHGTVTPEQSRINARRRHAEGLKSPETLLKEVVE